VDISNIQCEECPENTYSTGGIESLKGPSLIYHLFKYQCFNEFPEEGYVIKNMNCYQWAPSLDMKSMTSGISSIENVNSFSEFFFAKEFKKEGYVNCEIMLRLSSNSLKISF
jgi:hypothetical protein